jgi:hypothetical protein
VLALIHSTAFCSAIKAAGEGRGSIVEDLVKGSDISVDAKTAALKALSECHFKVLNKVVYTKSGNLDHTAIWQVNSWYEAVKKVLVDNGAADPRPSSPEPSVDESRVDINGLPKARVLVALFNAASPQGMGFLLANNKKMTEVKAETILARTEYVDYIAGCSMKLHFNCRDGILDAGLYDRDNGKGSAKRIIENLRADESSQAAGASDGLRRR